MAFTLPHRPVITMDIECFKNYFLLMFKHMGSGKFKYFEQHQLGEGATLDYEAIHRILRRYTMATFNGKNYDNQILSLALSGVSNSKLKEASDHIILGGLKPWDFRDEYGIQLPGYVDDIDLIEVAPGQAGLKLYGARMHSPELEDLPFDPDDLITLDQVQVIRKYCGKDNNVTHQLYDTLHNQIELRIKMSNEYSVDLRSKSDAQIAEAVMTHEIGKLVNRKITRPIVHPGTRFKYQIPDFISYQTPLLREMLELVRSTSFTVLPNGSVQMPEALSALVLPIGKSKYQMGIGGLHSTEKSQRIVCEKGEFLCDRDVASYYPSIILLLKLFPKHLGKAFLDVYSKIVTARLKAKSDSKNVKHDSPRGKELAEITQTLKIVINGLFGKLGSKWSKVYSPDLMIQVTITGQLSLLMLIEEIELNGLSVVSANTDGVVIHGKDSQYDRLNWIVADWESRTGFDTEETPYEAIYSRDVNSYVAVKPGGKFKGKGEFGSASLQNNPTCSICTDAMVAYLTKGIPVEKTIVKCRDITKFLTVRRVNGGGMLTNKTLVNKPTLSVMRDALLDSGEWRPISPGNPIKSLWESTDSFMPDTSRKTIREAYEELKSSRSHTYLGKVVRWYFGRNSSACITYKTNGNLVSKSNGAVPMMDLSDEFPKDINYSWYILEAKSMLARVGCMIYEDESCDL